MLEKPDAVRMAYEAFRRIAAQMLLAGKTIKSLHEDIIYTAETTEGLEVEVVRVSDFLQRVDDNCHLPEP